jgi:AraC-like DNA-binding protein/mannose-6-phosphate isomerase-like protein (cupin superfamily)
MNLTTIQFHSQTDNANIRLVKGTNISHTFPCHIHKSFSLGIVKKGQRVIRVKGEQHIVSSNECFMINPHQPHSCSLEGKTGHDYWVISINPQLLRNVFREIGGKDAVPYFSQVKITDSSIINRLAAWLEKRARMELTDWDELTNILGELVLRYGDEKISVQPPQIRHSVVMLASEYIEANLTEVVRLDEIAATVHISPFYLNRMFQKEIGIPPYTYLLQTRIKKSLELLLQTNSITEVTHHLGFSDQSHFTRLFKRIIGITPKRFLDLHRTSTP